MIILKSLLGLIILLVFLAIILLVLAGVGYLANRYILDDDTDEFFENVIAGVGGLMILGALFFLGYLVQEALFST